MFDFEFDDEIFNDLGERSVIGGDIYSLLCDHLDSKIFGGILFQAKRDSYHGITGYHFTSFNAIDSDFRYSVGIAFDGDIDIDSCDEGICQFLRELFDLSGLMLDLISNLYVDSLDSCFASYSVNDFLVEPNWIYLDFSLIL